MLIVIISMYYMLLALGLIPYFIDICVLALWFDLNRWTDSSTSGRLQYLLTTVCFQFNNNVIALIQCKAISVINHNYHIQVFLCGSVKLEELQIHVHIVLSRTVNPIPHGVNLTFAEKLMSPHPPLPPPIHLHHHHLHSSLLTNV